MNKIYLGALEVSLTVDSIGGGPLDESINIIHYELDRSFSSGLSFENKFKLMLIIRRIHCKLIQLSPGGVQIKKSHRDYWISTR